MSAEVASCPRGHEHARIIRDGIQSGGGRQKQRWRCVLPDGSYHRFLGVMSRTLAIDGTCVECENHIAPHEGPVAPAEGEYLVREIAGALVDLGRGQTYTDAAKRVRARANIGKTSAPRDVINGQTVAEWMADFVPAIASRHNPTEWPAVLVLDSLPFYWTDPLTKKSLALYCILAAFGYDKDGSNGRLWKLEAAPSSDGLAWAEFLGSLPGKPESIVCDQDNAIRSGIDIHWGEWATVNLVHHCEFHLTQRVRAAFDSDKLAANDPAREVFRGALKSRERWDEFEAEVRSRSHLVMTNRWLDRNETWMRGQTQGRSKIPPVYSNSAVEQPLRELKAVLRPRAFMFRNRARLNQLLSLIRMAYLRVDNATDYATDIRAYLDAHHGRPHRTYREAYDPTANAAGEILLASLWAEEAQLSMRDARIKRALAKLGDSVAPGTSPGSVSSH